MALELPLRLSERVTGQQVITAVQALVPQYELYQKDSDDGIVIGINSESGHKDMVVLDSNHCSLVPSQTYSELLLMHQPHPGDKTPLSVPDVGILAFLQTFGGDLYHKLCA